MPRVKITRRLHFSAAHRLHREDWSDERNLEVFGLCASPNWHGHNYEIDVTVSGEIDPETGFVMDLKELKELALARGRLAVQPFSEENQLGVGCVRCHGPELTGGVIIAEGEPAFPPDLTTVCGGPNTGHEAIYSTEDIYQVIAEGRNAMPSWSIRFEGALDDQQINDIVVYLVELSSENVAPEDNVCLNEDASEAALKTASTNPRDP